MPWYPGQNAQGNKVFGDTPLFARGIASQSPTITQPGTAGPGTAVLNGTGYDCMVYVGATVGFGGISLSPGGTVTNGTVPLGVTVPVYVPAGASISVNYTNTGVLTWHWIAV